MSLVDHLEEPALVRRQLGRHLRRMNERENVSLRVLTFAVGAHPAVRGRLTVLDLEGDVDPDVVYLETLNGGRYLEMPFDLARYRSIFDELRELAVPLEEYL